MFVQVAKSSIIARKNSRMSEITFYNVKSGDEVHTPALIIHGTIKSKATAIQVHHPQLPALTFPVNSHGFKTMVALIPGENSLWFTGDDNTRAQLTLTYVPLLQNPPIHLCLLVGKDSQMTFDSPASQIRKEGGNGLDLAVRKLRMGARIMQAFTNEQMVRNGFGQRTFRFVEEYTRDTLLNDDEMRNTVKIHILRSEKTVAELRDANIAQQNPNAKDGGALFGIAMRELERYGAPFNDNSKTSQAAVMFLDTHWDKKLNLITAHAALGGGTDKIKLAIFGSHGLYSWPTCFQNVVPYLMDDTRTSKAEVANDCNECSTHWECLTVTLGAFMHEIGHLLGCPHQENGVMLRDYVTMNRSFLTREAFSVRINSYGAQPPILPKNECTWNRLDIVRFLFHPSFSLPQDFYDPEMLRPGQLDRWKYQRPSVFPMGNSTASIRAESGIYCIEIVCGDLARAHLEYLPKQYGGPGPQKEVVVSLDQLRALIPPAQKREYADKFAIKVHAINASTGEFNDFPKIISTQPVPMKQYGFASNVVGIKSTALGNPARGPSTGIIPLKIELCYMVRVYYGSAVDGLRFYTKDAAAPPPQLPPRTYLGKVSNMLKGVKDAFPTGPSVLFGNENSTYADLKLEPDEVIAGFNLRSGAWVDGIQIVTSKGRMSEMFGNKNGGSSGSLMPPANKKILGVFGNVSHWVDAFGIVYEA